MKILKFALQVLMTVHCVRYALFVLKYALCSVANGAPLCIHCKLGRFADGTAYKVCTVACEVLLTVHSVKFQQCLVEHALSTVKCC